MRAASRLSAARSLLRGATPRLPSASARRWSSDWSALQLSPESCAATVSLGLERPTAVQALAIPQMLQGHSVGFAGATGTGKTMAFLLPVVEQLRQHEKELPAARRSGDARALILAPTRALAVQIGLVAKSLSHHLRFRVRTLAGGDPLGEQRTKMYSGCDVLVATPERLLKVLAHDRKMKVKHGRPRLSLRRVRHVVLDEADEMLLRGPESEPLRELLHLCDPTMPNPNAEDDEDDEEEERMRRGGGGGGGRAQMPRFQLILASATLPARVRDVIARRFPATQLLVSSCAHRPPPNMRHEMRAVQGDKLVELVRVLAEPPGFGASPPQRTLVFCRGVQSACAVQHTMREAGLSVSGFHSKVPP